MIFQMIPREQEEERFQTNLQQSRVIGTRDDQTSADEMHTETYLLVEMKTIIWRKKSTVPIYPGAVDIIGHGCGIVYGMNRWWVGRERMLSMVKEDLKSDIILWPELFTIEDR